MSVHEPGRELLLQQVGQQLLLLWILTQLGAEDVHAHTEGRSADPSLLPLFIYGLSQRNRLTRSVSTPPRTSSSKDK